MSEGYLPPVVVTCIGDAKDFMQTVAEVKAALRDLEDRKADPSVGLNLGPFETGIAEADAELDALGAKVVEPTVRIRVDTSALVAASRALGTSGMASMLGVPSSPVGRYSIINSALAGWASSAASGGGSSAARGSVMAGLLTRVLGGGGGGGGVWRGLGMGTSRIPFLGGMAGVGTLAGLMGFGAEHVLTTGLGVAGSAVGGLLGGGLLGLGSLGVMGVGMGTDMAGIGQAAGDIRQYGQLQSNLAQAAAVYGKNSLAYKRALYQYNQWAQDLSPSTVKAVGLASSQATNLHALFDKFTGPAETIGANIITSGMGAASSFIPTIGKYAAKNMGIMQSSLTGKGGLFPWLQSSTGGLGIFTDLEKEFTRNLPTAMHAFTQFFELFAKTIDTASHYTGGFIQTLDRFFTKWNNAGWSKWQAEIGKLIADFRVWWAFLKQIGVTIYDVFRPAVGTGQQLIVILTNLLKQVDGWLTSRSMKGTLGGLFGAHNNEITALGGILRSLLPVLEQATQAFLKLSTNGASVFTTLLKAVAPFISAIGSSGVGSTLLGWAATLLLIRSRLSGVMNLGGGLKGTLGKGLGLAGYGAVGGLMASQALGLHGSAQTAMTVGTAGLMALPAVIPLIKQLPDLLDTLKLKAMYAMDGIKGLAAKLWAAIPPMEGFGFAAAAASAAGILVVATGVYLLIHHFGLLPGLLIAGTVAVVGLTVAMWALDAVPVVALVVAIGLAVAGLIAGIILLVTHWKQVWGAIESASVATWGFLYGNVFAPIGRFFTSTLPGALRGAQSVWSVVWGAIQSAASAVWNFLRDDVFNPLKNIFQTAIIGPIQTVAGVWSSVWNGITSVVQGAWSVLSSIFGEIKAGVQDVTNAVNSVGSLASHLPGAGLASHLPGAGAASHLPLVGSYFGGHASGTYFSPGGYKWVGERGPELMHVPRASSIYPHEQSKRMMGGMGGSTFHQTFVLPQTDDPHAYANEIGWEMGHMIAGVR